MQKPNDFKTQTYIGICFFLACHQQRLVLLYSFEYFREHLLIDTAQIGRQMGTSPVTDCATFCAIQQTKIHISTNGNIP